MVLVVALRLELERVVEPEQVLAVGLELVVVLVQVVALELELALVLVAGFELLQQKVEVLQKQGFRQ